MWWFFMKHVDFNLGDIDHFILLKSVQANEIYGMICLLIKEILVIFNSIWSLKQ